MGQCISKGKSTFQPGGENVIVCTESTPDANMTGISKSPKPESNRKSTTNGIKTTSKLNNGATKTPTNKVTTVQNLLTTSSSPTNVKSVKSLSPNVSSTSSTQKSPKPVERLSLKVSTTSTVKKLEKPVEHQSQNLSTTPITKTIEKPVERSIQKGRVQTNFKVNSKPPSPPKNNKTFPKSSNVTEVKKFKCKQNNDGFITTKTINLSINNEGCLEKNFELIDTRDDALKNEPKQFTKKGFFLNLVANERKVTERTINVETKKFMKEGKWHVETVKTETITNENGTTTKSKESTVKELQSDEVPFDDRKSTADTFAVTVSPTLTPFVNPQKTLPASKQTNKKLPPIPKDTPDTFARQVLVATNSYRKIHGVTPLKISEKLNKLATEWAERLAKFEKMEHGNRKDLGENIYCKTSSQPFFQMSGQEVVENWYNEVHDHVYDEEPSQGYLKTGHFTQLVWTDSKEMGVAFARNKNGHMAFVVAYFSPKGNWIGEFRHKVPPPGGFLTVNSNGIDDRPETSKSRNSVLSPTSFTSRITAEIPSSYRSHNMATSPTISYQSHNGKESPTNSYRSPKKTSSPKGSPLTASVAPSLRSMGEGDFLQDFLNAHNSYRNKHGVKPLRLSTKLCKFAQEWSDKLAKRDIMEHRDDNEYGENLYMKWAPNPNHKISGSEPVDSWYSEIEEYEFGKEPLDIDSVGHFTQVIWADSEELGVGMARSKSQKIFLVADYDPPGNYMGMFSRKVPPPR